ncbi:hypothetical protein BDR07DRAFT_506631 [Suillus spraguei]|nr:hypothetical protein BDR07DRAFT_506631 [Suillus spraguei]
MNSADCSARRISYLCALCTSTIFFCACLILELGVFFQYFFFVSMGSWVGIRYFFFRDEICDRSSCRLYNVCIFYSLSVA